MGDFPSDALAKFGIEAQHPDDFALSPLETFPDSVTDAAQNHRTSLKNLPKAPDKYLAELDAQGLSKTVLALREFIAAKSSDI